MPWPGRPADTWRGIFGIGQPPTGSKDPSPCAARRWRCCASSLKQLAPGPARLPRAGCGPVPGGVIADGTTDKVLDYMIERFRAWYEGRVHTGGGVPAVSARKLQPATGHPAPGARGTRLHAPPAGGRAWAAANKRVPISSKTRGLPPVWRSDRVCWLSPRKGAGSAAGVARRDRRGTLKRMNTARPHLACLAGLRGTGGRVFDDVMVNAEDRPAP